jgi:hypothetical protein
MKLGKKEHFSHWEWGRHSAPKTRAPPKIGKNKIFWRKIVIFHTKYLKNVRASLGN